MHTLMKSGSRSNKGECATSAEMSAGSSPLVEAAKSLPSAYSSSTLRKDLPSFQALLALAAACRASAIIIFERVVENADAPEHV